MWVQVQERKAHERLRKAKADYTTLQDEANNDLPAGIAGLEDAKLVGSLRTTNSVLLLIGIRCLGSRARNEIHNRAVRGPCEEES
jgi:hypothetical protein